MSLSRRSLANAYVSNRRAFLKAGASLAIIPWLAKLSTGAIANKPTFATNPFTLGVASGDPSPDGMVLWTRLAPDPLNGGGLPPRPYEVRWELADGDNFQRPVRQGTTLATPQLGHSVHVTLEGLAPDRWYSYRFLCGDAVSPVGRTRTTPAVDVLPDRLRFAFTSCQHYETGLFTAYEHMAKEDLDLILHLGDYIYEYAGKENRVRKHTGPEITTLEHYRNRHAQYRADPMLAAAHAKCPWLVVWDDHEFDNNCAGEISEESYVTPEEFLIRRANAYQAYYESMPLRATTMPRGPHMQLYRRVAYGRLANFEMLDTRQYRSDQPNGDGLKPLEGAALAKETTMLGDEQERWLMQGLLASQSTWNILGQQVMMARVDRVPGDVRNFSMDQWSGYDVARTRLLRYLEERQIPNPIVLTGDIHSNWVNDLKLDFDRPDERTVATEFVCTSLSSGGNGTPTPKNLDKILAENPFVKFHNAERGYTSCTVTPDNWRSDYQVVEYVDKPGAPLVTRASFVVENGRPGVAG